jgi:anti-sigma regulatory factor (Ser/Thr protein kinase)
VVAAFVLPLPRSSDSVGLARSAVREVLLDLPGDVADVSALLANELVANAIAHGEGSISLAMEINSHCVRFAVTDEGAALPELRESSPTAESGRGLSIVNALATRWGVDPTSQGKSVWFELVVAV